MHQLRFSDAGRVGRSTQERNTRVNQHAQSLAVPTYQEPVPDQRRKDHVGDCHPHDANTGITHG